MKVESDNLTLTNSRMAFAIRFVILAIFIGPEFFLKVWVFIYYGSTFVSYVWGCEKGSLNELVFHRIYNGEPGKRISETRW